MIVSLMEDHLLTAVPTKPEKGFSQTLISFFPFSLTQYNLVFLEMHT